MVEPQYGLDSRNVSYILIQVKCLMSQTSHPGRNYPNLSPFNSGVEPDEDDVRPYVAMGLFYGPGEVSVLKEITTIPINEQRGKETETAGVHPLRFGVKNAHLNFHTTLRDLLVASPDPVANALAGEDRLVKCMQLPLGYGSEFSSRTVMEDTFPEDQAQMEIEKSTADVQHHQ